MLSEQLNQQEGIPTIVNEKLRSNLDEKKRRKYMLKVWDNFTLVTNKDGTAQCNQYNIKQLGLLEYSRNMYIWDIVIS